MKKIISLIGLFLLLTASNAFAWFACSGAVQVNTGSDGSVLIRADAAFPGPAASREICSLNSEWKGIPTATCKAWFSQTIAAQLTNKQIWIQYLDDAYTCATMPTYGDAIVPYTIHIE